tara:strand:+ start:7936 stop:8346 length:411 start_codon:yes stop_codon:yes gene_type:complete
MVFIVLILSSCESKDESLNSVYFFKVKNMTTIIPIECENIISERGLYKLSLNEKLTKKIENAIEEDSNNTDYNPDIRYKIKLTDNKSICLDYSGNFITSGGKKGQTDLINELNDFIDKHMTDAIIVTDDFDEPWNN